MTSDIEVGKKIRSLRKIRGISLQQMASETGMSYFNFIPINYNLINSCCIETGF